MKKIGLTQEVEKILEEAKKDEIKRKIDSNGKIIDNDSKIENKKCY